MRKPPSISKKILVSYLHEPYTYFQKVVVGANSFKDGNELWVYCYTRIIEVVTITVIKDRTYSMSTPQFSVYKHTDNLSVNSLLSHNPSGFFFGEIDIVFKLV